MLKITAPARRRKHRTPAVPPPGPVLQQATFALDTLTLVFDRPVTLDRFDGQHIVINDTVGGRKYAATAASLAGAATVEAEMADIGPADASPTGITLTAIAAANVVSTTTASRWPGAAALVLPFA